MFLKSIFEIEIDDSKFRKFKELFDRYQAQVKKLPPEWQKMNASIGGTKSLIDQMVSAAAAQGGAQAKQADGAKKINTVTKSTALAWSAMTGSVASIDKHITAATTSLVKWSTLTAAFGSLLGAGSLFGLSRLASTIAAGRRASLGLGVSYGQRQAFMTNYDRLINPSSLLSSAAAAKYDITSPEYNALVSSGMSQQFIKSHDASQISVEFLHNLQAKLGGVKDRGMIGPLAHSYGFDKLMSQEDIRAYLNAPADEKAKMDARFSTDSKDLGIGGDAQRKWQDLVTQLDRASKRIQVVFMEKLAAIEPGLEKLSEGFVGVIKAFADGKLIDEAVKGTGEALDRLAKFIETPEFTQGVEHFADFIGKAASAIWKFISAFGGGSTSEDATFPPMSDPGSIPAPKGSSSPPAPAPSGLTGTGAREPASWRSVASGAAPLQGEYPNTRAGHEAFIRAYAAHIGIDPDFAAAVAGPNGEGGISVLSPNNPNSASVVDRDPVTGQPFSFGDFQMNVRNGLGAEARRHGIDPANPSDWQRSDAFALDYMHHDMSPWAGDRVVESYRRSGRLPGVIVRPNVGGNPVISNYGVSNSSAPVPSQ